MRIFYTGLFFLSTLSVWSQTFTVSGSIIDQENNPVAYSNILLLKAQDSTIVKGTTSDDFGKFTFNNVTPNTYILKASFISYRDNYFNLNVDRNIEIPALILEESIETLSEIELVYRKPTLKREVDRLVFNVEKTALSEGNLMEVLRNTPSVIVMDDAITVKGSQPTVYINDRKVHISPDEIVELLQGTTASNIKSVEVITNPPARYDAESGVVLNIIMSKNLVSGYNGSVFSSITQGVFPKSNFGMSNYFKGSKVSLFANYSYNDRKVDRVEKMVINYPDQKWDSDIDRNLWSETHNFNFNFDWSIADNKTLSLSANTQFLPFSKQIETSNTQITPIVNDDIARFYSRSLAKVKKQNLGFDIGYAHVFKKDNAKLSLKAHHTTYDYEQSQDINTDYFLGNSSFIANNEFNTNANQEVEILTSQVDYMLPISETSTFEIGAKASNVSTKSDIIQHDIIGGIKTLNNNNSDIFSYDETVFAGYAGYDKAWESLTLSMGLRVEETDIVSKSVSTNQNNDQNYLEWFPTVNLGLQVSEKVNIFTNFKRSITRPHYKYLNPFKHYLSDNTFVTGNPALKPYFTSNLSLGASINDTFTLTAYYKKYKGNIFEIAFQDNVDNTLAYTYLNIDFTEEIGFDFEAYFNVVEKWNIYFGTSIYRYKDRATFFNNQVDREKWSNFTIFQNNFSFLKDNSLTANFTLTYFHDNVIGLLLYDSRLASNLSIRKTIFKGKGNVSLTVSDLFNKQDYFVTTKFLDQNHTLFDNFDTRYIRLGFRYSFGNTKLSTNERTSTVDERDRLEGN